MNLRHCCVVASLLLGAAASAQDLNTITKVEVKGAQVIITGSKKPNFTTFTMTDPSRLVIDISEAVFAGVPEEIEVGGVVTAIKTASYGSDAAAIARVLIGFGNEVETDIQAQGTKLLVKITGGVAPAAVATAPPADGAADASKRAEVEKKAQEAEALAAKQRAEEEAKRQAEAMAAQKQADEDAKRQAAAAEAQKVVEAERNRLEEDKRKEQQSLEAKRLEEEERRAKSAEAEEAKRLAEDERKKKAEETAEAKRQSDEEKKRAREEAARLAAEEKKKKAEEDAEARRLAAEERKRAKEEALAAKKAAAEASAEERKRKAEEAAEARRVAAEEKKRKAEEAAEARRLAAEEKKRAKEEALAAKRAAAEQKANSGEGEERAASPSEERVALSSGAAPDSSSAGEQAPSGGTPVEGGASVEVSGRRKTMTLVGFKQEPAASRVFVRTNEPVRYKVSEGEANTVVLELDNTNIDLANNERALDTSHFDSPVAMVRPDRGPGRTVRIAIKLRENVPYQAKQDGNEVSLEFSRPGR